MKISELFHPEPKQWGLRGHPYLWREMRDALADVSCPDNALKLHELLAQQFEMLTGTSLAADIKIHVERFAHGGISSGMVDAKYWKETLIPLLCERLTKSGL